MDETENLRLEYMSLIVTTLFKLDLDLARDAYKRAKVVPQAAGADCGLTKDLTLTGDLSNLDANGYLNFFNELVTPFESRYGITKFWNTFMKLTMKFYAANRDAILKTRLDIPLMNFDMKCCVMTQSEYANHQGDMDWDESILTVKTRGLVVYSSGTTVHLPVDSIITVGREIYRKNGETGNILRSVDFRKKGPMQSLLISAQPNVMLEFIKLTSFMRKEFLRLEPGEKEILFYLSKLWTADDLVSKLNKSPEEVTEALKRLKELEYTDEYGIITPTGIQALHEYRRKRMEEM